MPLQNRITPFGEFIATSARGTLMGNRGGRLHDAERRLGSRRWTNKAGYSWSAAVSHLIGESGHHWYGGWPQFNGAATWRARSKGRQPV